MLHRLTVAIRCAIVEIVIVVSTILKNSHAKTTGRSNSGKKGSGKRGTSHFSWRENTTRAFQPINVQFIFAMHCTLWRLPQQKNKVSRFRLGGVRTK